MQIRKIDWINRPNKIRVSSKSLTFLSEKKSTALHTTTEKEKLCLHYEGSRVSFIMLHTMHDRIIFSEGRIEVSFSGFSYSFPADFDSTLIVEKDGERISFFSKDREILTLTHPAFKESASFGMTSTPTGEETTFFFYSL